MSRAPSNMHAVWQRWRPRSCGWCVVRGLEAIPDEHLGNTEKYVDSMNQAQGWYRFMIIHVSAPYQACLEAGNTT